MKHLLSLSSITLLSIGLPLGAARATHTTYVSSPEVQPGLSSIMPRACEAGQGLVGGGFDTISDHVLIDEASRPMLEEEGWEAAMHNPGSALESFTTAALCMDAAPVREVMAVEFPVPPNAVTSHFALCPRSLTASNGGVAVSGIPGRYSTALLAPAWPFDPDGQSLRERDPGQAPGPSAWEAVARNDDDGADYVGAVSVLCAEWPNIVTWIEAGTIGAGAVESKTVLCPAARVAVGGGVDADDRQGLYLVASAPVFVGASLATRIVDVVDFAPDPIGWRVTLRNDAEAPRNIKAAAICVPEVDAVAVGPWVLAALACARSRARTRTQRDPTRRAS